MDRSLAPFGAPYGAPCTYKVRPCSDPVSYAASNTLSDALQCPLRGVFPDLSQGTGTPSSALGGPPTDDLEAFQSYEDAFERVPPRFDEAVRPKRPVRAVARRDGPRKSPLLYECGCYVYSRASRGGCPRSPDTAYHVENALSSTVRRPARLTCECACGTRQTLPFICPSPCMYMVGMVRAWSWSLVTYSVTL